MSIDRYYSQIDGKWVRISPQAPPSNYWVDVAHGGNHLIDERYYFPDLSSAFAFYEDGWRERLLEMPEGGPAGLDHSGLYSNGRLIHGHSIHGDAPGCEG